MKNNLWVALTVAGLMTASATCTAAQTRLVDETLSGPSAVSGAPTDDSGASSESDTPAMSGDAGAGVSGVDSGSSSMSGAPSDDSSSDTATSGSDAASSDAGSPDTATGDDDY